MAHHLEITDDVYAVVARRAKEWDATTEQILQSPHVLIGSMGQIVETLLQRRERYGISYVVFLARWSRSLLVLVGHETTALWHSPAPGNTSTRRNPLLVSTRASTRKKRPRALVHGRTIAGPGIV